MLEEIIKADGYLLFIAKRKGETIEYSYKTKDFYKADLSETIKQFEAHARRDFLNTK